MVSSASPRSPLDRYGNYKENISADILEFNSKETVATSL